MQNNTQTITRRALLEKANILIKKHEDYFTGQEATDVVQQGEVLMFHGPFFSMQTRFLHKKPWRYLTF